MIKTFQQIGMILWLAGVLVVGTATNHATVFKFDTDPFAGSAALTTPGRQVVGGEDSIVFNIATDVFELNRVVFGVSSLNFINDVVGNIPASGINLVVNQTFDNDGNPGTPFGAGNAATLIAGQITSPGPGFFVYFNSGLDLPRLVFSTDLSDPTADLKILFRLTNLGGQAGRDAIPSFTATNFRAVPDAGGSLGLLSMASCALLVARRRAQRSGRRL